MNLGRPCCKQTHQLGTEIDEDLFTYGDDESFPISCCKCDVMSGWDAGKP